mmetsp:Transcript_4776/g.20433  ORF Transcript_4776/g.20433 Transcript_4776/m.20433 type:complete len:321 (-) Transcript_4776:709-1671(-)
MRCAPARGVADLQLALAEPKTDRPPQRAQLVQPGCVERVEVATSCKWARVGQGMVPAGSARGARPRHSRSGRLRERASGGVRQQAALTTRWPAHVIGSRPTLFRRAASRCHQQPQAFRSRGGGWLVLGPGGGRGGGNHLNGAAAGHGSRAWDSAVSRPKRTCLQEQQRCPSLADRSYSLSLSGRLQGVRKDTGGWHQQLASSPDASCALGARPSSRNPVSCGCNGEETASSAAPNGTECCRAPSRAVAACIRNRRRMHSEPCSRLSLSQIPANAVFARPLRRGSCAAADRQRERPLSTPGFNCLPGVSEGRSGRRQQNRR